MDARLEGPRQRYEIDWQRPRRFSGGSQGRDYDRYYNDYDGASTREPEYEMSTFDVAIGAGAMRIAADVRHQISAQELLSDPSGIQITVENDSVTLSGTVESRQAKRVAGEMAESVPGVREVRNRLRVRWNDFDLGMQQHLQMRHEERSRNSD